MARSTNKPVSTVKEEVVVPKASKKQEDAVVTINLQPLLIPISNVVSAVILGVLILIGLVYIGNNIPKTITTGTGTATTSSVAAVNQEEVEAKIREAAKSGQYIVFGNPDSKVILTEFSDPSCPYCHIAGGHNGELNKQAGSQFTLVKDGGTYVAPVPEMKKLVDEGKAAFLWAYSNGHGNGEVSTKILYCAHEQGKFWEAHDIFMTAEGYTKINDVVKNDMTKADQLIDMVASKLNRDQVKDCLNSGKYDGKIASDQAFGSQLGVSGTPGFFINGTLFPGAFNFTEMEATINQFI